MTTRRGLSVVHASLASTFCGNQLCYGFTHGRPDSSWGILEVVQIWTDREPGGTFTEHDDLAD